MARVSKHGDHGRDSYRIEMGNEWTLEDLAAFPNTYGQLYGFVYASQHASIEDGAFDYPWRGGYSTVNFFSVAQSHVLRTHRPRLLSIQYSSPGWIELSLVLAVAMAVRVLVKQFVSSARDLNQLYQEIYHGLHDRRLMRLDARERALQLKKAEAAWLEDMTERMTRLLGAEQIQPILGHMDNPIARLKLLLSVFRRVRTLAEYELDGKARL